MTKKKTIKVEAKQDTSFKKLCSSSVTRAHITTRFNGKKQHSKILTPMLLKKELDKKGNKERKLGVKRQKKEIITIVFLELCCWCLEVTILSCS